MTVVIGTAGHIDHGKSTLLQALTGIDPDRLPDEQRRGLTIDVGYAHGSPDDGPEVDFVDVPGHDRLVGNMLVGAGEMDAALLVVAADDGPRAQTWEHIGLLDAMGIGHGLVAVTKTDLVDAARAAAVCEAVGRLLGPTTLAGAPIVAVSAVSGDGLDRLKAALAHLRDRLEAIHQTRPTPAGAWLSIDRVFGVRGHGVVVTGTSRGGAIARGDRLRLLPDEVEIRVRAVQVHDTAVERAPARGRAALNLAGASLDGLRRGGLLVAPGPPGPPGTRGTPGARGPTDATATDRLLVALRPPAALPGRPVRDAWPPRDGLVARLHTGTEQVEARLGRSGRDAVALPDGRIIASLRLERPMATAIGEPFVLRRPPPAGLVAGGIVLDASPPQGRARRRQTPEAVIELATAVDVAASDRVATALVMLHGQLRTEGGHILAPDIESLVEGALLDALRAHHRDRPGSASVPLAALRAVGAAELRRHLGPGQAEAGELIAGVLRALEVRAALVRTADGVHLPGHEATAPDPGEEEAVARLLAALDTAAPPPLAAAAAAAGVSDAAVRRLERDGRIVVVDGGIGWSAPVFERLADLALGLADAGAVTPAALRDASGTSRRYVLALLEELDRRGVLARTPGGHARGPQAPARTRVPDGPKVITP